MIPELNKIDIKLKRNCDLLEKFQLIYKIKSYTVLSQLLFIFDFIQLSSKNYTSNSFPLYVIFLLYSQILTFQYVFGTQS